MTAATGNDTSSRNTRWRPKRRFPRWSEVLPMFDPAIRRPRRSRALKWCADLGDVRALARKRVPRMVFDFVDGAAGSESSLNRSRHLFNRVEFEPRLLRDVSKIDLTTDILGVPSALPFYFAPTGATRLMHHGGEAVVAQVAADLGIPYCLSTLGTTSVEDLAARAPDARRWFQLYLMTDRGRGRDMVERAWAAGFDTLILTIDTPVPGRRSRDVRNGLQTPRRLSWKNVWDIAGHPSWWIDKISTDPIEFAMVEATSERPEERMSKVFDPAVSVRDIEWLRSEWQGRIIVKGVQSVHDARLAADAGADALQLSTHGGRQLEHAPLPFELIPQVREALNPAVEVIVDGGVMSGVDIVACLARGADSVAIGRGYLYGLMAAGPEGVRWVADTLESEMRTMLALLGCTSIDELRNVLVRIRPQ